MRMSKWHIVRTINFLLSLPPVPEYQLFCVRLHEDYNGRRREYRRTFTRLVWRKDRFRAKVYTSFFSWINLTEGYWIEDSFGRVLLRASDYIEKDTES